MRFAVDHRDEMGQFILTGSAVPANINEINHTGTGRIARLKMRPMTLWESKESTGTVSLCSLFEQNDDFSGSDANLSLEDIAYIMCRGGWPKTTTIDDKPNGFDS